MDPLGFVYYLGYRYSKYSGMKKRKKLPFRTISIGNITTGGTGKTPATIAVAEEAKRRGFSPIILTRGYRGSARGPCFVTKKLTAGEAGDEPLLMADRLRDVPVVKGGDRYKAGIFAIEELAGGRGPGAANRMETPQLTGPVLFILDDGFQHWGLHRDKDIVLIDSGNPFGNGMLLPIGRLREPLASLSRADIIVLTKKEKSGGGPDIDNIIREIRRYNPVASLFFAEHAPVSLISISGEKISLDRVSGKKVFAFCSVGGPESFKKTVESTGGGLAGFKAYRDHYSYSGRDVLKIRESAERCGADWIVTTQKDIIKIRELDPPENILVLKIEFSAGTGFFEEIFSF
ncbi:MAG: tetraacyldisaccharide 4'-kinase [Nitrospirota bacterium]|nr:tetraacyldisaccharide 4'-kinase [Nitrospirota bacterium]